MKTHLVLVAVLIVAFASAANAQKDLPIAQVQGTANVSPVEGQRVRVTGIVTARTKTGFFVQSPDDQKDADLSTSEGVFVFTGNRTEPPADAATGNLVAVSGDVQEFRRDNDTLSLTITELSFRSGRDTLEVKSKANELPRPVILTPADFKPNTIDELEKYEGMRVAVDEMLVVGPTGGREDNRTGLFNSDGTFFGVLKVLPRPFREPGIDVREILASPDKEKLKRELPKLPVYDNNPEIIRVDTGEQTPLAAPLDVPSTAVLKNLTGVLHYASGRYTLLTDPNNNPTTGGGIKAAPLPVAPDSQFVVAGMNIENFFDDVDDPGIKEDISTPEAFQRRLKKISFAVRELMNAPDVIGTVEIENINALKRLAEKINADAVAAGKPDPKYEAFLFEGNDGRGIDNGFLVKTSRVKIVEVKQFGKDEKYKHPVTKEEVFLNDRPPVMLRAAIAGRNANEPSFAFTAVINHLKSYSGFNDPKQMENVRLKKRLQSEFLANWVNARQKADPGERIVLMGDFNSYQFSDGVLDMIGTITGKPAAKDAVMMSSPDLVQKDLIDLVDVIANGQRYSFVFDGSAQALDHMLVTENMRGLVKAFGFARVNADFPDAYRNDAARPERFSDHDPAVAYFSLP